MFPQAHRALIAPGLMRGFRGGHMGGRVFRTALMRAFQHTALATLFFALM